MKNSIKQMLRMPVYTVSFFLLLTLAALLMTLGTGLWMKNEKMTAEYEEQFITIGTVNQKANSFEQKLVWDAEDKDYWILRTAQYNSYFTIEDLMIPDVEYLAGPEQRAYYGSWVPEYVTSIGTELGNSSNLVAEFSPLEDCRPDESVQIKITKVLSGNTAMENATLFLCDHSNPEPEMLYKDKTYVASISTSVSAHGDVYEKVKASSPMIEGRPEYIPLSLASKIYQSDGSRIKDDFQDGQTIFEVEDGFYETPAGERILDLADTTGYFFHTMPVTATNKTCLLMPFYNGGSFICEGRDIREEEYEEGDKVCLAPRRFMENNNLTIGDKITTRFFYTNNRRSAGMDFVQDITTVSYPIIDEKGNRLEPFEVSEYTVVGIYDTRIQTDNYNFRSGADELIVPMKSIESGGLKNLLGCGPMSDFTTSFQIHNGTIEDYQKKWAEYGSNELEITFYDMGYSQLHAGIKNMKNLSLFFLIIGIILTVLLLFFFSHLFISKQAKRTAIERSLGMSSAQCRWSILSGILLLVWIGSMAGSVGGTLIYRNITAENIGNVYYDSSYSVGASGDYETFIKVEKEENGVDWAGALCIVLIMAAGAGISVWEINKSLRREPMELLTVLQKE